MSLSSRVWVVGFSLLVGCGGAAATASGPQGGSSATAGVTFTKKPRTVGMVSVTRERNETNLEMDITVDGKGQHSTNATVETIERRTEILAVAASGAASRVKVSYVAHHRDESGKGLIAAPVEGKTYVVEGDGGKAPTSIKDAAGNAPPEAEAKIVAGDFKHLGRVDSALRGLPDRPLAPGDSIDEMAKVMLADDADDGLETADVRFEGAHDAGGHSVGVFGVSLSGKLAGDQHVKLDGKISLLVDSSWEVEADAKAPLDISQQETKNGSAVSIVAHGTLHTHKETSYPER